MPADHEAVHNMQDLSFSEKMFGQNFHTVNELLMYMNIYDEKLNMLLTSANITILVCSVNLSTFYNQILVLSKYLDFNGLPLNLKKLVDLKCSMNKRLE